MTLVVHVFSFRQDERNTKQHNQAGKREKNGGRRGGKGGKGGADSKKVIAFETVEGWRT